MFERNGERVLERGNTPHRELERNGERVIVEVAELEADRRAGAHDVPVTPSRWLRSFVELFCDLLVRVTEREKPSRHRAPMLRQATALTRTTRGENTGLKTSSNK